MVKEYGYEYDATLDEHLFRKTAGKVSTEKLFDAYCLRSGRDALKAIAKEYEPCVALLPALACDSMVHPFELYHHRVKFYNLNPDFTIDLSSFEIGNDQILFLYMDFFGKPSINDDDLEHLKEKGNIVFIEDRTHNLIWARKSSFCPDFIMASLRKWIPVPDGGLLWGKVTKKFQSDTSFSEKRLDAQCMRHEYLKTGNENLKTEFRRVFSTVSEMMDNDEPSAMSAYSFSLAKRADWEFVRLRRRENATKLISILSSSPFINLIQNQSGCSDLYVAFTVPNRDEIQKQLAKEGIFNTIIWPLTEEQKRSSQTAKEVEGNMLAAPCDQRYTVEDMKYIGARIVKVVADVNR